MRKCCCCVGVHVGAVVLGILGVLLAALELVALVPYLMGVDPDVFNPIERNLETGFYILEKMIKEAGNATSEVMQSFDVDGAQVSPEEVRDAAEKYMHLVLTVETVLASLYLIFAFLMTLGVCSRQRCLMLPYLVTQMAIIIVFVVVGICATVFFFLLSIVMGCVCLGVLLVATFLFCYFWSAVHKAFLELGASREYMYAPAPVKPIYNPMETHKYHPSAPQHFNLD